MNQLPGDMGIEMMKGFASGPRRLIKSEHDCPECQDPLFYSENGVVHQDPPRKRVLCKKCDYTGFVPFVLQNSVSIDITDSCTIRRYGEKK